MGRVKTLRAKGTLISEPRFYPLRDAIFPTRERANGLVKQKPSTKAFFPFLRGKIRIPQGVENRGSLISVPLALRELKSFPYISAPNGGRVVRPVTICTTH